MSKKKTINNNNKTLKTKRTQPKSYKEIRHFLLQNSTQRVAQSLFWKLALMTKRILTLVSVNNFLNLI